MNAAEIIAAAEAAGVRLFADGSRLGYRGSAAALRRLLPVLADNKAAIMTVLIAPMQAVRENIAERAAIITESCPDTTPADAERAAVRLVQCRVCKHFKADPTHPLAGIGACAVDGWPQSSRPSERDLMTSPTLRQASYCAEWTSKE